jgi:glycosyltransferase involved in cell wall biosynthesis
MYDIAFIVEQVLGHITHGENLKRHVPDDPDVRPHWIFAPYATEGLAARLPVYRSNWTVRVGLRSRRLLRSVRRCNRLDAIFFHTQVPAMLSLDHVRRTPSVISLDATPIQYDELGDSYLHHAGPLFAERLKHRAAVAAFEAARHLVAWSDWAKAGLVEAYEVSPDKITVIPPGVSTRDWARPEPRTAADGRLKLLFVGGDFERKGGMLLLAAFRSLRHLGLELHVVTRDELEPEAGVHVHRGLSANGAELRRLYHESDVFVLPTFGDCLPMVLSEAGAAGLPIVSTRLAAIPEVVVSGDTGLLVAPGDLDQLVAALRWMIEHPEERLAMGRRACQHVSGRYDTATNTAALVSILKAVADGSKVSHR